LPAVCLADGTSPQAMRPSELYSKSDAGSQRRLSVGPGTLFFTNYTTQKKQVIFLWAFGGSNSAARAADSENPGINSPLALCSLYVSGKTFAPPFDVIKPNRRRYSAPVTGFLLARASLKQEAILYALETQFPAARG